MIIQKLSIIIPAYNEWATIAEIIKRVELADIGLCVKELVIVDDGSTDGTRDFLKHLAVKSLNERFNRLIVLYHEYNQGKGAAIRTGLDAASGDYVVIQDADLEYDPNDFKAMIELARQENATVVYGSRLRSKPGEARKRGKWYYYLGGLYLSLLANLLYGIWITDEPTCYKMFKTDFLRGLNLKCAGFEFCPEVTAKTARAGVHIYELPISYNPRSVKEGKKIKLKDVFMATWTLLKYRFMN